MECKEITMRTKQEILKLKQTDIYSLLLFVLYKLSNIPDYSTLSELAYVLDKDSLLNLCEYFGGTTLKIPTIEELESLVYSLTLYQYVDIEHKSIDEALKLIGKPANIDISKVKSNYFKIAGMMEEYSFTNEQS